MQEKKSPELTLPPSDFFFFFFLQVPPQLDEHHLRLERKGVILWGLNRSASQGAEQSGGESGSERVQRRQSARPLFLSGSFSPGFQFLYIL